MLSALKKSERDQGIILRFFNPAAGTRLARFVFGPRVKKIAKTNLNEVVEVIPEEISNDGTGEIELNARKNEVQTILCIL